MFTTLGSIIFWLITPLFIGIIIAKIAWGKGCMFSEGFIMHIIFAPIFYICSIGINLVICAFLYMYAMHPSNIICVPDNNSSKAIEIYSLGECSNCDTSTVFLLGQGNNNTTYSYIIKKDGEYIFKEVNANNFKIEYTNNKEPKILIDATKSTIYPKKFKWLFKKQECNIPEIKQTGTIYIPKNTIITPYKTYKKIKN